MTLTSYGDLAQVHLTRHQGSALRQRMTQLTQELASGQSADVARHLRGSLTELGSIAHQMTVQNSYRSAAREAGIFTAAMQIALDQVQSRATDLGASAALAATTTGPAAVSATANEARGALDAMLAALNTDVAGRPVFGGTEVSDLPLGSGAALLDAARLAVSGAADVTALGAALDTFFGPGGGFETAIYRGSSDDPAPYRLGNGASVQLSLRGDDPALRGALRDTVMAALADDAALGFGTSSRMEMIRQAGTGLLTGSDSIAAIRAHLGHAEARIEQAATRIGAELSALEMTRATLTAVDPFETAHELERAQFQLETIYTLTARSARLNLVNFL